MEETLVHSVLLSVPQAAAIWLVILAVAVISVIALSLTGRRAVRDDPGPPARSRGPASGFAAGRASADDYAEEIEAATDRAADTARRGRDAWERAQEHLELTWATFEAADLVARRSSAAAAFGSPDLDTLTVAVTDSDYPDPGSAAPGPSDGEAPGSVEGRVTPTDRERYLHRAATAACRRRELTVHELNDILAHRGDWDPDRHPVQQETMLHRAVRRQALADYREAAASERQAWHTAETAAEALRSLREEACVARLMVQAPVTTDQLWWAGQTTDPYQPVPDGSVLSGLVPDESVTTMALPVGVVLDESVATIALPVRVPADDVDTTIAIPLQVTADESVTTMALPIGLLPVGSAVGPLMVVPLPPAALAALQNTTVPSSSGAASAGEAGPVVPAQAGAPAAESLPQSLATAGADPGRR